MEILYTKHHIPRLNPQLIVTSDWYSTILCHGGKINIYNEIMDEVYGNLVLKLTILEWPCVESFFSKNNILNPLRVFLHQNTCKFAFVSRIVWCRSIMWREKQGCMLTSMDPCHSRPLHPCIITYHFNAVHLTFPERWGTVKWRPLPPPLARCI
jgi:hypothetical protein